MKRFLKPYVALLAVSLTSVLSAHAAPMHSQREFVVCIDPGHPSETSDGASEHGLSENRLNWEVANRLKHYIHAWHITFVCTKASLNQRVPNRERAETANHADAELLIRLHCDAGEGTGYVRNDSYTDTRQHEQGGSEDLVPPSCAQTDRS